jgi:hypothetical protein
MDSGARDFEFVNKSCEAKSMISAKLNGKDFMTGNNATKLLASAALVLGLLQTASAETSEYANWQHSGSLHILTTPEGANLPGTASEEGFPLLVRLNQDCFDFSQAKAKGEDIRFASASGTPLAYQIDQWDAAGGTASIWVRIPVIKGNAHQEIKLYWGEAEGAIESNSKAVFNESNGYLSVWHMNEPVKDEVGKLEAKDMGTTPSSGMIGKGRHFDVGKGIHCENITTFPTGSSPHSTELWFREEKPTDRIFCWGSGEPRSMVQIISEKPPRVFIDCYHGAAGVHGQSTFALGQWVHVIHTYENGESRLYLNGCLDGIATAKDSLMDFKSPVQMYLGGWRGFGFKGDMDEVRISKVARSADWVKLQYENQKPRQTAVGSLVQPGNDFLVSEMKIDLLEGESIKVMAKAGGAQKCYWIVKSRGSETMAEVDRLNFTVAAGRVTGDQSFTLQFKAVYADSVKTIDVPVTIRENIPDPVFTLKAPATWNGRAPIEVVPEISNSQAMQTKGVGELKYDWTVAGLATLKEIGFGKLILKRSQNSGTLTVTATLSNGGQPVTQSIQVAVKEPEKDAWVQRTPAPEEKPVDNQFYARDDQNEGTLYYNGTLSNAADSVFLKVYADDKLIQTESQKPRADKSYAFAVKLKAGLIKYRVEFGSQTGSVETVLHTVTKLVCGDAYIIQGQSNAVAYNYYNVTNDPFSSYSSDWIRTYGSGGEAGNYTTNGGWGNATLTNRFVNSAGGVHFVGYWGLALASNLVANYRMPICILNGAVGGTRIDQHVPDPANHYHNTTDDYSIYGNLLRRVVAARLTHGIRGVLWHQGEADCSNWGPTGDWNYKFYQQNFVDLSAAWKQDMPNLRHYYLFQVFASGCGTSGTFTSDMLREEQRTLTRLYSSLSLMSTLAFPSGANCHFNIADYTRMGLAMAPLVARDNYGLVPATAISAPNLQQACFTSTNRNEITLVFDQAMTWNSPANMNFYLDRLSGQVTSGRVNGNVIKLQVTGAATNQTIAYVVDQYWHNNTNLIYGANGIAALTFYAVPIASVTPVH